MAIIESSQQKGWLVCVNSANLNQPYNPYKLRIFLPIEVYDQYKEKLYPILRAAVADGTLWGFKRRNAGDQAALEAYYAGHPHDRHGSNPLVLYLPIIIDYHAVQQLCSAIEVVLTDVSAADQRESLCAADLSLDNAPHISFRLEKLDGQYVAIRSATTQQLNQLKQSGEASSEYKQLNTALRGELPPAHPADAYVEKFHRDNFKKLNGGLSSHSVHKQFESACDLLGLDPRFMQREEAKDQAAIDKAFRKKSLRFHDDRLHADAAKECGRAVWDLLRTAKAIVARIAKEPEMLDRQEAPMVQGQRAYQQEYGYELAGGYVDDFSFYTKMAQSSATYVLKKKTHTVSCKKETVGVSTEHDPGQANACRSVEMYIPKQEEGAAETIRVPGYEAFRLLDEADALPNRFGRFRRTQAYASHPQLRKRMVQPPLVMELDSALVKEATIEAGYATDAVSVFGYFYRNHPETLYGGRIEQWLSLGRYAVDRLSAEDTERVETLLLEAHPEQLAKMSSDALIMLLKVSPKISSYLLRSPESCVALDYYFNNFSYSLGRVLQGFPDGLREGDCFSWQVVDQIFMGNVALFHLLSSESQARLLDHMDARKVSTFFPRREDRHHKMVPDWMIDELSQDFDPFVQANPRDPLKDCAFFKSRRVEAFAFTQQRFLRKMRAPNGDPRAILEEFSVLNRQCLDNLVKQPELLESERTALLAWIPTLGEGEVACDYPAMQLAIDREKQQIVDAWVDKVASAEQDGVEVLGQAIRACEEEAEALHMDKQCQSAIINPIRGRFKERFRVMCDALKSGERPLGELAKLFVELGEEVECIMHDDCQDYFKDPLRSVMHHLEEAVQVVIGVMTSKDRFISELSTFKSGSSPDEDYGIGFPVYGIRDKTATMDNLRRLYDVYAVLQKEASFFEFLSERLECTEGWNNGRDFIADDVEAQLLRYVENELHVFADDYREQGRYKKGGSLIEKRYGTYDDPLAFTQMAELCRRLGRMDIIEAQLPLIYDKLREQHALCQSDADARNRYQNCPERLPIERYMSIRAAGFEDVCPMLELSAKYYLDHGVNGSVARYNEWRPANVFQSGVALPARGRASVEQPNALPAAKAKLAIEAGDIPLSGFGHDRKATDGQPDDLMQAINAYQMQLNQTLQSSASSERSKSSANRSLGALNELSAVLFGGTKGGDQTSILSALKDFDQATSACPHRQMALKIIAGVLLVLGLCAIVAGTGGAAAIPIAGAWIANLSFAAHVGTVVAGGVAVAGAAATGCFGKRTEKQELANQVCHAAKSLLNKK